jgi:hypothetical protein
MPVKSYRFPFGITVESFQTKTVFYDKATDATKQTTPKFKVITIL